MTAPSNIVAMGETLQAVAALPEHEAQCLPGRFYTDPDYFRHEVETFLSREWHCIGRADEIAGPTGLNYSSDCDPGWRRRRRGKADRQEAGRGQYHRPCA